MPSIYIINPSCTMPGYHTAEAYADEDGAWIPLADLSTTTVAALVPPSWDVRLTDESLSPVDLESQADFIAITGKASQRNRMVELSREFRRRGRVVVIGGSFASLSPDEMRPHADILVTGELEELAPKLFADMARGDWADQYDGGRADIGLSPVPRWDLYPTGRAMVGTLQTTRGCPFSCEFCDVIQYQGRKQRHKNIGQVLSELSALHAQGFRDVFLVDDNFTVHRRWAREVLDALAEWNAAHSDSPVRFLTQASLDLARDDDLMDRCRTAGLRTLFMGVETINENSLRETGKLQNLLLPTGEAISRVVAKGIAVQAGVIVGFDHDGPEIFDSLLDFFQDAPLPDLNVGVLTAPATTDLYRRLAREGRLLDARSEATAGTPFETNFQPALMSRDALLQGTRRLCTELYQPERYERRMRNLIDQYGGDDPGPLIHATRDGHGRRHGLTIIRRICARGQQEADMVANILRAAGRKPAILPTVVYFLGRYEQIRLMLDHVRAAA